MTAREEACMEPKAHWETVYRTKAPDAVSWYAPHLETSIQLIERICPTRSCSILDAGGGESTLVDDLLARGYANVTVLDISPKALEVSRQRIGAAAARARWIVGDVTTAALPVRAYDVWHDRAVFHFLTRAEDRVAYVRQVAASVRTGGFVIVATFGPEGPQKCSGLDVVRYGADALHSEFGSAFRLLESRTEVHTTPFGTTQQFVYCMCRIEH
jgi:SAM-dependent methyltransferase